jgi:hypothetical protein
MKMQKDRNNQNGMQNVYITVSNALDQSDKTRIEVARDLTVAQAVRQEGLAPAGAFDIFDASGRVVSDQKASQLADENVYVGVQKVAGGAEWDAGWGAGGAIAVEPAVNAQDDLPGKGICFVSSFNEDSRNTVIPSEDDTVRAAGQASGLVPRDGSPWDVYDGMGRVITDEPAEKYIGQTLWINASAVGGGAGLPISRLGELRTDYPSLQVVRQHVSGDDTQMIVVNLPDNNNRTKNGHYQVAVHVTDPLNHVPVTYVLNIDDVSQRRYILAGGTSGAGYDQSQSTLPGTNNPAWWVCHGSFAGMFNALPRDAIARMGAYLNHIISVLNS